MQYKYILGVDPSGNFNEGKGTTGFCLYSAEKDCVIKTKSICAEAYKTQHDYWHAVLMHVITTAYKYKSIIIVMEDYTLYATKASSQINSRMETPKLIGVIEYYCEECEIPVILQPAHTVKNRWANEVLIHKKYINKLGTRFCTADKHPIDRHAIDAIRHAVHYGNFKNKKEKKHDSNKIS